MLRQQMIEIKEMSDQMVNHKRVHREIEKQEDQRLANLYL